MADGSDLRAGFKTRQSRPQTCSGKSEALKKSLSYMFLFRIEVAGGLDFKGFCDFLFWFFFCCFGIAYTNFNLMFFLVVDHFFVCACSIGSTVKKEGVSFVGFVIRVFKLICCFKLVGIFAYRG